MKGPTSGPPAREVGATLSGDVRRQAREAADDAADRWWEKRLPPDDAGRTVEEVRADAAAEVAYAAGKADALAAVRDVAAGHRERARVLLADGHPEPAHDRGWWERLADIERRLSGGDSGYDALIAVYDLGGTGRFVPDLRAALAALADAERRIAAAWKYAHTHAAAGAREGSTEPCCRLAGLVETALAVGGPFPPDAVFDPSWTPRPVSSGEGAQVDWEVLVKAVHAAPEPAPEVVQPATLDVVADALARHDYGDQPDEVDRADRLRQAAAAVAALMEHGGGTEYGVRHSPGGRVSRVWDEAVARRDGLPAFVRTVGPWTPLPPREEGAPGG